MTAGRTRAIVLAALLAGAATVAVVLASDREDAEVAWAVLRADRGLELRRHRAVRLAAAGPESRTGELMVLLGFAWFVSALSAANPPLVYTFALVAGGLWGGVFLQLAAGLPVRPDASRLRPRDRARGLPRSSPSPGSLGCCSPGRAS